MLPLKLLAVLAACLGIACAAPFETENEYNSETPSTFAELHEYRLPTTILPLEYHITLRPYLLASDQSKQFTFDGETTIVISPNVTTRQIVLHAKKLTFSSKTYTNPNGIEFTLNEGVTNEETDTWTTTVDQDLIAHQNYTLKFKYTGLLDVDMHGFYRSSYRNAKNETKWLASTQFQTNHARRAFPSFDEPFFKAKFNVKIQRPKSLKSVSNMPLLQQTAIPNSDLYEDVYETTPIMSTYLLAFIVSDFNERSNGQFGVLARPEYYEQTDYAFNVGQDILAQLDEYLGLPYYTLGNNKMHMGAIPDFSAGAMENWGLLTYRERSLLVKEDSTALSARQAIAAVIAHEQAHMWFGDLVTCHWWSYTWLNEGFARYFQYFGTAMAETKWELEKQFVVDQIQSVFNMDSTNSTNPLSDENTFTPAHLSRMFNSISYNKGGSFIRMMKSAMGESNFRASLHTYLDDNKHNSTKPSHLLDAWKKHWPVNSATVNHVTDIFNSFTEQVGYPVITFNVSSDRKSFEISQKRFLLNETDGSNTQLQYTVPITYAISTAPNFDVAPQLVLTPEKSEKVTLGASIGWIVGNVQQTGYYRVNYDEASWHELHHALDEPNFGGIHEINRAQIVDDIHNFARAGLVSYDLAFAVTNFLSHDVNYLPLTSAINAYNHIAIRMGVDNADFSAFTRQRMSYAYNQLGFEERTNDTALQIYARNKINNWMCRYGNNDCNAKAKEHLRKLKEQNVPVPVNLRSSVYCSALRMGVESDFDFLFKKYQHETVPTEETLILNNLGCVKDSKLIAKFFDIILTDDVRLQDKSSALSALYTENVENVSPVFALVTEKYKELAKAMNGYSAVATVISNIASRFTETKQQNDLKQFNTQHKAEFGGSQSTLEAAERTVEKNLLWDSNKLPGIRVILKEELKKGGSSNLIPTLTLTITIAVAFLLR